MTLTSAYPRGGSAGGVPVPLALAVAEHPAPSPTPRPTARIVLLDGEGRVFLFCYVSPETGRRYWITHGGGVHPGERHEDAALRELQVETGLRDVSIAPWVWSSDHV